MQSGVLSHAQVISYPPHLALPALPPPPAVQPPRPELRRLEGGPTRLMLQSRDQLKKGDSFISGFSRCATLVSLAYYPPPEVPSSYSQVHVPPPPPSAQPGGSQGAFAVLLLHL